MILSSLCLYSGVQGRCRALKDVFCSQEALPIHLDLFRHTDSLNLSLTPTLLITKKLTGLLYDFIDTINT